MIRFCFPVFLEEALTPKGQYEFSPQRPNFEKFLSHLLKIKEPNSFVQCVSSLF